MASFEEVNDVTDLLKASIEDNRERLRVARDDRDDMTEAYLRGRIDALLPILTSRSRTDGSTPVFKPAR